MDIDIAKTRIVAALEALRQNDSHLLEVRCNERSIAGCLHVYLSGVFPSHNVDIEYNRHGLEKKRVRLSKECRQVVARESLVLPDIVIHRRGSDSANEIVLELKLSDSSEHDIQCDREKLEAIKSAFGYTFSVLLVVPVGPDRESKPVLWEWNRGGLTVASG